MKNKKLFKKILIITFAIIVLAGIIVSGIYYYKIQKVIKQTITNNTQQKGNSTVNAKIIMAEAKIIAEKSSCIEKGSISDDSWYNEGSKTWWFRMIMKPEFYSKICSPACVVFEENKTTEINWMCTGGVPSNP